MSLRTWTLVTLIGLVLIAIGYAINISGSDYFFYFVLACVAFGIYFNYRIFVNR